MSKIDKTAGLPKLPEGQIWSVQHVNNDGYYSYYGYYEVQIVQIGTKVNGLFRKRVSQTRDIIAYQAIMEDSGYGHAFELTSKNILATAKKLIKRRKSEAEAERIKNLLLGDYPPNTLVGVE